MIFDRGQRVAFGSLYRNCTGSIDNYVQKPTSGRAGENEILRRELLVGGHNPDTLKSGNRVYP